MRFDLRTHEGLVEFQAASCAATSALDGNGPVVVNIERDADGNETFAEILDDVAILARGVGYLLSPERYKAALIKSAINPGPKRPKGWRYCTGTKRTSTRPSP